MRIHWTFVLAGLSLLVWALPAFAITIYTVDESWFDGDSMRAEYTFGSKYYILTQDNGAVIRIGDKDVLKIVEDEHEDAQARAQYHYERGLKFKEDNMLENARREFNKVLRIYPGHKGAVTNLQKIEKSISVSEKYQQASTDVKRIVEDLKLREDQVEFLKQVAVDNNVDVRSLIRKAIDNWIAEYREQVLFPYAEQGADKSAGKSKLLPD